MLKKSWRVFWGNRNLLLVSLVLGASTTLNTFGNTLSGGDTLIRCSLYIFSLFLLFIMILSNIGIIKSVVDKRKSAMPRLLRAAMYFFWRVFGLSLLGSLSAIPLAFGLGVTQYGTTSGLLCAIPFLLIFIPFVFVMLIVINLSQVKVVLENKRAMEAFRESWSLATENQWVLFKLGFVLLGLSYIFGNTFTFGWNYLVSNYSGQTRMIVAIVTWILYFGFTTIIFGYSAVCWTIAYLSLSKQKNRSILQF